jgi:hypothetical protein
MQAVSVYLPHLAAGHLELAAAVEPTLARVKYFGSQLTGSKGTALVADSKRLITDLRQRMSALEADIRSRAEDPAAESALRAEWQAARRAGRTSVTFEPWQSDRLTQTAAAWLLITLFVRFAEDNELLSGPYLGGAAARTGAACNRQDEFYRAHPMATGWDWIAKAVAELHAVAGGLYPRDADQEVSLLPSEAAAAELISFWRRTDAGGELIHDFTDRSLDTRFLGNLYQDLSEQQRSAYALLETPDFIADFLLDQTLEPAVEDFGLDGLRVIDPVCGSGTFVTAAFRRLADKWVAHSPASQLVELVEKAMRSVHGVDKNAIAVMITRFRVLIEAVKVCKVVKLADLPRLEIIVVLGDSLLLGRGAPGQGDELCSMTDKRLVDDLLGAGSYHAVFGNPPYITPKDKAEAHLYRVAYPECMRTYSLAIPFIVRFFGLATSDRPGLSGYVGMLVSNSFMKREFGRSLIERFLPSVALSRVIDTSGVFIPGHGIPTVMLFGRSGRPQSATIKVTFGTRGEPSVPQDPGQGIVWQSILRGADSASYRDDWSQVEEVDRRSLEKFPWSLAGGDSSAVLRLMETGSKLGGRVVRMGYFANTGADDIFDAPPPSFARDGAEAEPLIPVITGSEVRDWCVLPEYVGVMLQSADERSAERSFPRQMKRLWPYRTVLENRQNYSGHSYRDDGRPWYVWHHVTDTPGAHPWSIVFSWVSTHNHFAVLRDHAAPLNSAPVIRLPRSASDADVLQLVTLLNSSLACFWLKQNSNSKGRPSADQTGTGEPWTLFYEFTGARLADFPLPPDRWSGDRWSVYAAEIDETARRLSTAEPLSLHDRGAGSPLSRLDDSRIRWERARSKLIALQEELDWEIYHRYGLLEAGKSLEVPAESLPELSAGERAFEIVLARKAARGEADTTWFVRHGIEPVTELPARWPVRYRVAIEERIGLIERNPFVRVLEQPEFKRRWQSVPWRVKEAASLTKWLLDRCEDRSLWYDSADQPVPMTINRLADRLRVDADVIAVARRLKGPEADLSEVLADIVGDEHVPYLAQFRYKPEGLLKHVLWERTWDLQRREDATGRRVAVPVPPNYRSSDFIKSSFWRNRGKFDVPKERFISYPSAGPDGDDSLLVGWAGWDHRERAHVLVTLIEQRTGREGWGSDRVRPLLAGLVEILPWVRQWHSEADERFGVSPAAVYEDYLLAQRERYRFSVDDLRGWTRPQPRRGRPPKTVTDCD